MEKEEEVFVPQDEQEVLPEEIVTDEVVEEAVVDKDAEARRQLTARAKAAEARAKEAEAKLKRVTANPTALDVEDYIDISTSLGGLDPVEQAYLAKQHKLTGESMKELRQGEDFQNWNTGYKAKLEKEVALRPSSTQAVENAPKSLSQRLANATIAEKEAILREVGMYKEVRPRADRRGIGNI